MELNVKLQAFEGPLDLLLHLIDKNKVNIIATKIFPPTEKSSFIIPLKNSIDSPWNNGEINE